MLNLYHSLYGPGHHSDPGTCLCHCRSDRRPGVAHRGTCLIQSDPGILKFRERSFSLFKRSTILSTCSQLKDYSTTVHNWNKTHSPNGTTLLTFSIGIVSAWPFVHVSARPCSPVRVRFVWSHVHAPITVSTWHWSVLPLWKTTVTSTFQALS